MEKQKKKFVARYNVQNGGCSYDIINKFVAKDLKEAKKIAEEPVGDRWDDEWELNDVSEVKTFEDLWDSI